jgi:hypothetical protein
LFGCASVVLQTKMAISDFVRRGFDGTIAHLKNWVVHAIGRQLS